MITVKLNSINVGLIFTLINAFVEFAFLSAMLIMLALYECKRLKEGKLINIRKHCRYVRLITLFAITLFISLEIIFSRTIKDEIQPRTEKGPCVQTQINIPPEIPSGNFSKEESLISFNCLDSETDTFRLRLGKYSTRTRKVECAAKEVFKYRIGNITRSPIRNGIVGCVGESIKDLGRACVTARSKENVVYLSTPYDEVALNETPPKLRNFYSTELSFDPTQYLEGFAKSAANLGIREITDEFSLRRSTFLRHVETTCVLKDKEIVVTLIPDIFLTIMVVLWTFSLISFGLMFVWRRKVFYNVQNTWDCTTKTSYRFDNSAKDEFYIKCIEANGQRRIYVTDSGEEDRLDFQDD